MDEIEEQLKILVPLLKRDGEIHAAFIEMTVLMNLMWREMKDLRQEMLDNKQ